VAQLISLFISFFFMNWRLLDERFIRRGELLLSLDFLEDYELDLSLLSD